MNYQLKITDSAKSEIRNIVDWYNESKPNLGQEFLNALNEKFQFIRYFPLASPLIIEKEVLRYTFLSRYPFVIYYKFKGQKIVVVTIYHTSQDRNRELE